MSDQDQTQEPERKGSMMLGFYQLLARLLTPLAPLVLKHRLKRGKEHPDRLPERKGIATRERPGGPLIWVHAASVGEFNAALPIVRRLRDHRVTVLVTTVTQTSAQLAETELPDGAIHQFVPLDFPSYVERFLRSWEPDLALFMESEIWPATMSVLSDKAVPLVFVNGRLSERSFKGWQRFSGLAMRLFSTVDMVLAQSEADGDRFRSLGAGRVLVTGNIKFDRKPLEADFLGLMELEQQIGKRPVWLAASTHPGEEEIIAEVHDRLSDRHSDLVTLIVPRHPDRGPALAEGLGRKYGHQVAVRSAGGAIPDGSALYLADTLGELGLFYRLSPVAFIGGSLAELGGQNPIEAVQLESLVLHGPHVTNFRSVYDALSGAEACIAVTDAASLAQAVDTAWMDPERVERQNLMASETIKEFTGALDRTMQALLPYLSRLE
ncbi:3-deoxy-D-manno-octulosonic acid transferase [Coralliovum pocilloporae]|uniref:3-deoxy-D-manno-octulosonic acid transferase n=1 Tax=Coralliovum pocilloporae TaxID=3066369 RepID=UPI00330771CA